MLPGVRRDGGMTREIHTCRVFDHDLVGTCHVPRGCTSAEPGQQNRIGVLLLNAGPVPRAGHSDLSVHIGDSLASLGVHVFRFDFPGLGDTPGTLPPTLDDYRREVHLGRNDALAVELAGQIRRRFGPLRLIAGGLCAATVPILRAASSDRANFDGVILLEPPFRTAAGSIPQAGSASGRIRARLRQSLSLREWLYFMTGNGRVASRTRPLRPLFSGALRAIGDSLPRDANLPLINDWRSGLARGTHSLVIAADHQAYARDVDRIIGSQRFSGPGTVEFVRVPGTNHLFASGRGRHAVLETIDSWVQRLFLATSPVPVPQTEDRSLVMATGLAT
jgi:hypothetical protein